MNNPGQSITTHDSASALVIVGAMHRCKADAAISECVDCRAIAEALSRPCRMHMQRICEAHQAVFGDDHVMVPRGLIGAASSAIDKKRDAPRTLAELRRYTTGDLSTAPAEPVYWEYRWKDTHPQTVTSGQWYPWEKVTPRNGHLETVESRLAELRSYIAQGQPYELRALYAVPQALASTPPPLVGADGQTQGDTQ